MPDEVDMMAAIARAVDTPVATGEIDYGRWAFKRLLDAGAASVVINSADNTAGDFAGSIFEQLTGGSNANSAFVLCGSHDVLTISDNVDIGSWLEVYCDGSTWYWTGMLSVSAVGLAVFST